MTLQTSGTLRQPPAGGGAGGTDPGALQKLADLADLSNIAASRGHLGLGTAALAATGDFDAAGDGAASASAAMATAISTAQAYADANKAQRLTPTTVKAGAYAATNGQLVPCDATAGAFPVTLPAAPPNGTTIGVLLAVTDPGNVNAVTITASGADVIDRAGVTTRVLRLPSTLKVLVYQGGTWYSAGGNLSLDQLDNRYDALGAASTVDTTAFGRWMQMQGTARRTLSPQLDELAAVAFGNVDTFVSWLTPGGGVTGCVGEFGIPANPVGVDIFNSAGAEQIATTRGTGPSNIESGRWAALLEAVLRYIDDVSTPAQPTGLPVIGWEARETTASGLNMFGADPTPNAAAALGITYPAGRVLVDHVNRQQMIGAQPAHGVALSAGWDGLTDSSALTRNADTTVFSTATPGPAMGASYCYGRAQSFKFLASLGIRVVRLPFRGERLFNDDGTLDPVELGRYDDAIAAAKAAGCWVILDWHAMGTRYFDSGLGDGRLTRRSMGQADGSAAQPLLFDQAFFASAWRALVSHYVTALGAADPWNAGITGRGDLKSTIIGYELMNEPVCYPPGSTGAITKPDMSGRTIWQNFTLAATWNIRTLDTTTPVYVHAYGGGTAASSFWDYHTTGVSPNHWITLSGGGLDPHVFYVMHTYFDSTGGGTYPDSYETTRQARAAAGYVAKPSARPLGGLMLPHGSHWPRTLISGQAGVPALANNVLTSNVYLCPLNRMAILCDIQVTGPAGTTRLFARPTGSTNAAATNAAWEAKRITNAGAPGFKPGPIFLGPDDRLDVLASVAGVIVSFTVYELPVTPRLHVVSGLALPAGDQRLFQNLATIGATPPVQTKARVANSGGFAHPMGFGWCAFNGAAVAANVQGKVKKAGGAVTAVGPTLQTAATAHCIGPGNATPGVPSNMIDVVLDPSDELWINSDQAGLNVWVLIEELGG